MDRVAKEPDTSGKESVQPSDLIPTAGKRAGQPSEAEHIRSLQDDRQKVAEGKRPDSGEDQDLSQIT